MKKVLIIAFYFNQTNEIASKRLRALGQYLPEYGWEPIILTPKSNKENEVKNCKIIETEYTDMVNKWLKLFKIKNNNEKNETNITTSKNVNNNLLSKIISLSGEIFAYPDGMKYWKKPAIKKVSKFIEKEDIDAIISSSFPITSHTIGYELKEKYHLPWIADLRDLWNMNPYIQHNPIRNYFEKRLETKILNNADILTTTSKLAGEKLQTLHPKKKVIPILSGYEEKDIIKNKNNTYNDKLNLTYAGTLYSGKRDPEILFKSISSLIEENKIKKDKIELNFYGDNDNLQILSEKYKLKENIKIHGFIPHEKVLLKQSQSDILLLISWNHPNEMIFIPGKLYEYLAMKKPILSIGYKQGATKDLIEKLNIGEHTSDINSTKKAILKFYEEFDKNGYVKFEPPEDISQYSMQNMAKNFSKILNKIVK